VALRAYNALGCLWPGRSLQRAQNLCGVSGGPAQGLQEEEEELFSKQLRSKPTRCRVARGKRPGDSALHDWKGGLLVLKSCSTVAWTIPLLSGSLLICSVCRRVVPQFAGEFVVSMSLLSTCRTVSWYSPTDNKAPLGTDPEPPGPGTACPTSRTRRDGWICRTEEGRTGQKREYSLKSRSPRNIKPLFLVPSINV